MQCTSTLQAAIAEFYRTSSGENRSTNGYSLAARLFSLMPLNYRPYCVMRHRKITRQSSSHESVPQAPIPRNTARSASFVGALASEDKYPLPRSLTMSNPHTSIDVEAQTGPGLPRTVTIDVPADHPSRSGVGLPQTLSRASSIAASSRIPVEFRTLSLQVHTREDLYVRAPNKDKDKGEAVKGTPPIAPTPTH